MLGAFVCYEKSGRSVFCKRPEPAGFSQGNNPDNNAFAISLTTGFCYKKTIFYLL